MNKFFIMYLSYYCAVVVNLINTHWLNNKIFSLCHQCIIIIILFLLKYQSVVIMV